MIPTAFKAMAGTAAMLLVLAGTASAAGAPPATPAGAAHDVACVVLNAVGGLPTLSGQPALTKSVVRTDNSDNSSDLAVTVTGSIPAQFSTLDVLDCLWIDTNGNGSFNFPSETMKAYTVSGLTIAGSGATRTATFAVHVPGAKGKAVCDRVYGVNTQMLTANLGNNSVILSGQWLLAYSQKLCIGALPPPDVPEVPVPIALTVTGALTAAGVVLWRRRRLSLRI